MTVILRDPAYRQRLARDRRKTEKAQQRRQAERDQRDRDLAAYLTAGSRLIKAEK